MIGLYIDPIVMSCPRNQGKQEFQEYIELLLDIDSLVSAEWISIYTARDCYDLLYRTDSYPVWNDLDLSLDQFQIDYIQPQDISRIVEYLITHTQQVEESVESHVIIEDPCLDEVKISPCNLLEGRENEFLEFHKYFAVMFGISSFLKVNNFEFNFLVTRSLNTNSNICLLTDKKISVNLQGRIEKCKDFLSQCKLTLPIDLDYELTYCISKQGIFLSLDPAKVGSEANQSRSDNTFKDMLNIYIFQKKHKAGLPFFNIDSLNWSIGKSFIDTAYNLGFLTEITKFERLLRTCCEIILEENLSDTHALRTTQGGNSAQRERDFDKAKAWRRDIDRFYHLHYWKTTTKFELASVVVHDDFGIPI